MEDKLDKHTLGICAMQKKIHSPHMQQILEFINNFNDFELIEFTEEMIFNEEVEKWPIVESMIVFFSTGFPYSKVLKYINLRKPFLPNDFEIQKIFWDRIKVMTLLKENNIPIPNEIIVEREAEVNNEDQTNIELNTSQEIEEMIDKYNEEYEEENKPKAPALIRTESDSNKSDEMNSIKLYDIEKIITKNDKGEEIINELKEYDEYIVYNGKKIMKPFVEKPRNGDDHNIYIYYPMSHGGGQTRLFRKTRNLSSLYYPNINKIRRDKSYIYEEYLQTDGFDIKVYTVGENYAHAEARKSPSLDGIVERSKGKEVRYPVNLNPEEKEIARKIVKIFKQNICGFDILRSKGISYVCDVNGWSFVKGNKKYFQDCAILLRKIILSNIDPNLLIKHPISMQIAPVYKEMILRNKSGKMEEELHSVVAVFRHADRSPKQKMKLVVEHPALLKLFEIFQENNYYENPKDKIPLELKLKKPNELMTVLKIVKDILFEKGIKGDELIESDNFEIKLFQIKLILEKNLNFEGLTRKIQMRPLEHKFIEDPETKAKKLVITKALMIVKWGGHITHSGIEQAKLLGNTFRYQFYPPGNNDKGEGLLRLHNTYRHDLKCYSSEEGRCLKSAAAFLQGLLQLEGNLIPVITSMVWKNEQINKLLDVNCTSSDLNRRSAKKNLNEFCNYDGQLKEKYVNFLNNENRKEQGPFIQLTETIGNFHNKMVYAHKLLEKIVNHLSTKLDSSEKEKEFHTYFITSKVSVLSRYDSDVCDIMMENQMKKSEEKILKKNTGTKTEDKEKKKKKLKNEKKEKKKNFKK
jgi:inositol hexakisphosphate/diphosphoinositol-pentakisphosphate kinase